MRQPRASIPILLTVTLVAMTIILTIGWQILVTREFRALVDGFTAIHWVAFLLGSLFFVSIITVAILQAVWLVREIRTNQRQQNFIDAVTHELHTPLASLQLYVDTLRDKELDEAHRHEFLGIMNDDLKRLNRTIDQILQAARTELIRSRGETVDLPKLLKECVEDARTKHDLDTENIRMNVRDGTSVRGDVEQLRVLFRNLLENAVRYAGPKVQVEIDAVAISNRKLEVIVADQGLGIPQADQDSIFLRFQRLSHEAVKATRGLGLGLYIVRNIARSHGGSVRAESEGEDQGSRFIVTLPKQRHESTHHSG